MRLPATLPNGSPTRRIETHEFALPVACCPRSKNPRPGSVIRIVYRPRGAVLEVGQLWAYVAQYKGGLRDEQGQLVVRDMEGMVGHIAQDCADVLAVPVRIYARIELAPMQRMYLRDRATPKEK